MTGRIFVLALFGCRLAAFGQPSQSDALEIIVRVNLEDGAALKTPPLISLRVPGQEAFCSAQQFFLDGTLRLRVPAQFLQGQRVLGCSISLELTGYQRFSGYVEDGKVITLKREGPHEGPSVSVASLKAPSAAKKLYDAGESAASRKKWQKAEESFRAAVEAYPEYSVAWSELGRVLQEQERFDDATQALNRARQIDPAYLKPVLQLASGASKSRHWEDERRYSDEVLKASPLGSPEGLFYRAEAEFHIGDLEKAEQFVRIALKLDQTGQNPESLVLLGLIFEKQSNGKDAAVEYRNYLEVAPKGRDAAAAKEGLQRVGAN